jgi:hypothetical protein
VTYRKNLDLVYPGGVPVGPYINPGNLNHMVTDVVSPLDEGDPHIVKVCRHKYDEMQESLHLARDLVTVLQKQLSGGSSDPTTDPSHPGHWLLQLGWKYHGGESGDDYGCDWEDPACKGTGKREWHTLVAALGIALGRVLDRPNAFQRLDSDDD